MFEPYLFVAPLYAAPMRRDEWNAQNNRDRSYGGNPLDAGYAVIGLGGIRSWFPAGVFASCALQLDTPGEIGAADIDRFVRSIRITKHDEPSATFVSAITRTGCQILAGDPDPHAAMLRIRDAVRQLLIFVLDWATNGLSPLEPAPPTPAPKKEH